MNIASNPSHRFGLSTAVRTAALVTLVAIAPLAAIAQQQGALGGGEAAPKVTVKFGDLEQAPGGHRASRFPPCPGATRSAPVSHSDRFRPEKSARRHRKEISGPRRKPDRDAELVARSQPAPCRGGLVRGLDLRRRQAASERIVGPVSPGAQRSREPVAGRGRRLAFASACCRGAEPSGNHRGTNLATRSRARF